MFSAKKTLKFQCERLELFMTKDDVDMVDVSKCYNF